MASKKITPKSPLSLISDLEIKDISDSTKKIRFQLSSLSSGFTRLLTPPDFDGTLSTLSGIEILSNKTLGNTNSVVLKTNSFTLQDSTATSKQAVFSCSGISLSTTRTFTLPNVSSTLVVTGLSQTFSEEMIFNNGLTTNGLGLIAQSGGITIGDTTNNSSGTAIELDLTGANDFSQIELTNSSLVSIKGIKLGQAFFIILINTTGNSISILNEQSVGIGVFNISTGFGTDVVVPNNGSVILSADINAQNMKLVAGSYYHPVIILKDSNFTIQDDSDTSKQVKLQASGISASTTRTWAFPDSNDTFVGLSSTQTLSNKTLTSPVLNGAVINTTVTAVTGTSGSPQAISSSSSGNVFTNEGVSEKAYVTLPSASQGLNFTFYCQDSDGVNISAASGDTIRINGTASISGGSADTTTVGSLVQLLAINSTEWIDISSHGLWVVT